VDLEFEKQDGLLPAIIQDHRSNDVLMLGYVNREALKQTQLTGEVHFFSRSRNRLWKKGETSGHTLQLKEIRVDCDGDALVLRVEMSGPGVCHEGYASCFFRRLEPDGSAKVIGSQTFSAEDVYGDRGKK
jgi:phosphoribosyl-AMP cyclohydrolase